MNAIGIYNLWRQVLGYFDAFIIGLTATPSKQTIGFFANNPVMEYGHTGGRGRRQRQLQRLPHPHQNHRVGHNTLEGRPGLSAPIHGTAEPEERLREVDEDLPYSAKQLDRDFVNKDQIRTVIRTFRDRLFTEIFPGRTEVPKTLVFAKDDSHADDITKVIREEFGHGNGILPEDHLPHGLRTGHQEGETSRRHLQGTNRLGKDCQRQTGRGLGKNSAIRTRPRIAVTVDMISTGTDVKPLECLLFMRNIFEQLLRTDERPWRSGRRRDKLKQVTPDAKCKTHFVLVDAVGVTESCKTNRPHRPQAHRSVEESPGDRCRGIVDADVSATLAARLTKLEKGLDERAKEHLAELAGGKDLPTLARILTALDPDTQAAKLVEKGVVGFRRGADHRTLR
ncbi:MAG: hypothetical protein U1D30_11985 [Planctomycetota bacterium]